MSNKRRRRPGKSPDQAFWGQSGKGRNSSGIKPIRPTPDPAALIRSLGDPPLTPSAAPHHLAVVYEEAVRAATALAAANNLLDTTADE